MTPTPEVPEGSPLTLNIRILNLGNDQLKVIVTWENMIRAQDGYPNNPQTIDQTLSEDEISDALTWKGADVTSPFLAEMHPNFQYRASVRVVAIDDDPSGNSYLYSSISSISFVVGSGSGLAGIMNIIIQLFNTVLDCWSVGPCPGTAVLQPCSLLCCDS